ncbi:422_t:CDS:2, partial [Dentiscutata heterogama]
MIISHHYISELRKSSYKRNVYSGCVKDIKSNIIIFAENAKVSGDKINITTICDKIHHENFKHGWWKVINNKLVLYNQHVVNHDEEKVYKFDSEIDWTKKTSWVRLGD